MVTFLKFKESVLSLCTSSSYSSAAGSLWPIGRSSTSVLGNLTVLFNFVASDLISNQLAAVMTVIFLLLFVHFAVSNFSTSSIYET